MPGHTPDEQESEVVEPYQFRVLKEQGGWALTVQTRRVGSEVIEDETLVRPGSGPWRGRSYEELLEHAEGQWRAL